MKNFINYWILIFTALLGISGCQQNKSNIPYPDALNEAAIAQDDISSIIENAIIIGNGDITALVYSEDGQVAIRLSKNDIGDWRYDTRNDRSLIPWKKIREDGKKGTFDGSGKDRNKGWDLPYPTPIPCGKILIDSQNREKIASILDIKNAITNILPAEEAEDVEIEIAALSHKNVFLIKADVDINLLSHNVKHLDSATKTVNGDLQVLHHTLPSFVDWPGMEYAIALYSKNGYSSVAVVSSFDDNSPKETAIKLAKQTLDNPEKEIKTHKTEWESFWTNSGVKLSDKNLESVWYRNLYFLRCVSKDNTAPPGLFAGMIQDDKPAWHSAHTMNYNAEQRNWGAYASNNVDLSGSYQWLIERYMDNARWLCKELFGFDAVYFPHNLFTYQSDHASSAQSGNGVHMHLPWGYSVGITGWAVQNIWWQYQYAPDMEFLKNTVYPMLKEAATFYAQFIETCDIQKDGKVLFGPSISPEHFVFTKNLANTWNETHGIIYAEFALETAIEAANILSTDKDDVAVFKRALSKLPDYPTYGEGDEKVIVAVNNSKPRVYNVPIPVMPVFPGERVTWFSPEEEKALLTRSIANSESNGNNDAVMTSIARSRLSLGDAYSYAVKICKNRQRPNGTLTLNEIGKRFNKFGHYTEQFAATAVVSELLIQSVKNIVRVFPAWEKSKDAEFTSLRAKGGFLVSSSLKNGECEYIHVKSTVGERLKIVSPWEELEINSSNGIEVAKPDENGIITIETNIGENITLKNIK